MIVFGIATVADLYMLFTLAFVAILYCRRRKEFTASERAAEMREEYSDYATRDRPGKRGKRRGGGTKPRAEYMPSDAL